MAEIDSVKLRFGIIGNNSGVNRALEVALKVASTDLSVLITGESGVGKEFFPQVIHNNSARKHGNYIAVNCGAIPEGTIDSELFGHEKGAFTGASESRKGYFEIANGGTIFLDEVAELPLTTQVRLLRVLQSGEFIKVGSSKVLKTNVRVVAATNVNVQSAIENGRFREDLFYRLSTVPIFIPPLRERKDDIFLLFRKFSADIAGQYHMPAISLTAAARAELENYGWPGNVRQLKNVAEQISVIEENRIIDVGQLENYLQKISSSPAISLKNGDDERNRGYQNLNDSNIDREMMYSVLRDMRMEISDIKRMLLEMGGGTVRNVANDKYGWDRASAIATPFGTGLELPPPSSSVSTQPNSGVNERGRDRNGDNEFQNAEYVDYVTEEEKTKESVQRDAIIKALHNFGGRRKEAAKALFISERTLYRRIKELGIDEKF